MTQKERRQEAAAKGYCASCCIRRPTNGMKTCEVCLGNSRREKRSRRARDRGTAPDGICLECLGVNMHREGYGCFPWEQAPRRLVA